MDSFKLIYYIFFSINLLSWATFNVVYYHMAALTGNYVNFGVFELYGDRALADALDIALKMMLSIPLADILAYRKVWFFGWMFKHATADLEILVGWGYVEPFILNMLSSKQVKKSLPSRVLVRISRLILLTINCVCQIYDLRMDNFALCSISLTCLVCLTSVQYGLIYFREMDKYYYDVEKHFTIAKLTLLTSLVSFYLSGIARLWHEICLCGEKSYFSFIF